MIVKRLNKKEIFGLLVILLLFIVGLAYYSRVPRFDTELLQGSLTQVKKPVKSALTISQLPKKVEGGTALNLRWKKASSRDTVDIYLIPNNGKPKRIARRVRSTRYTYQVPSNLSGSYRIGINSRSDNVVSNIFAIERPKYLLTVTTDIPNGRYNIYKGSISAANLWMSGTGTQTFEVTEAGSYAIKGISENGYDASIYASNTGLGHPDNIGFGMTPPGERTIDLYFIPTNVIAIKNYPKMDVGFRLVNNATSEVIESATRDVNPTQSTSLAIELVPNGSYTITMEDVPGYVTPAPKTVELDHDDRADLLFQFQEE